MKHKTHIVTADFGTSLQRNNRFKPQKKLNVIERFMLGTLVTASGLGGATSSFAAPTLEEVIVTAQKQEENIQNVPISIAVLGGEELKSAGIDTQKMLGMTTPNIAVNANANFVAPYIRGIGTQYANPGLEPSVATYFNDLYLSRASAGLMNFHDIERVEVLKGPQGTLYGRNTTGGAIRIITKDPTDNFEAGAGITLGNYNKRGMDFFVSGPLTEGLLGRLSGQIDKNDGWVENVAGGPDVQDRDLGFIHSKLYWEPSDKLSVAFMVDYTRKRDHEGQAFQPLFKGAPEQIGAAFGGISSNEHDEYSGNVAREFELDTGGAEIRVDYTISDSLMFASITGYRFNKFTGFADLDATSLPMFNADTELERTEDWSQELQLIFDDGDKVTINTGLFFFYENGTDNFGLGGTMIDAQLAAQNPLAPPGAFTNSFIGGDAGLKVESGAWYGQGTYDFSDEWQLMLGLRYTQESKNTQNDFYISTQQANFSPVKPYPIVIPVADQKVNFYELSPKIQLTWTPAYGVMFFASFQEGFKSGGFNLPQPTPALVTEVESETIRSTEIGWKTQFDRIRFNGAIFHYQMTNLQLQVTDPAAGITSVRNAGSATVNGIESDLTFAATENLELAAGFGWQDAKFGDVPGDYYYPCAEVPGAVAEGLIVTSANCAAFGGLGIETLSGNYKDNELPQSPQLTSYLRGTYTQSLSSMGTVVYSLIGSYTDDFSWTPDNRLKEPSKTLVNANVTWQSADEKYQAGVFVTNLTDEEYNTHKATFPVGGWKVPGAPRMYGARVGFKF